VWKTRIEEETGAPLEAWVEGRALARLVEGGFLFLDDKRIVATPEGRQRLNAVLAALLV
jgi:oxygen-independent coproporphyrinogen-3 oxidase